MDIHDPAALMAEAAGALERAHEAAIDGQASNLSSEQRNQLAQSVIREAERAIALARSFQRSI